MDEAGYGYWGFSPSNNPAGGYREYGVDALGMDGPGYTSDQERTDWDQPYEGCPDRAGEPAPTSYGDGVVTPHASFLALRYAPRPGAGQPRRRCVRTSTPTAPAASTTPSRSAAGPVSKEYLALDQGMVVAALGNALTRDSLRDYVSRGALSSHGAPAHAARGLLLGRTMT